MVELVQFLEISLETHLPRKPEKNEVEFYNLYRVNMNEELFLIRLSKRVQLIY